MGNYYYRARDIKGNLAAGVVDADTIEQGVIKLQQKNLFVLDIAPNCPKKSMASPLTRLLRTRQLKLQEVAIFCRQLSFMLDAGVPLLGALQLVLDNKPSNGIENLVKGLGKELRTGKSFSGACEVYAPKLPPLMIHMIQAGETGGFLDQTLLRLADYFESELDIKEKVKTAMTYPTILLLTSLSALVVMLVYIIPIFAVMISQMSVPIPAGTQIVLTISSYVRRYWYFAVGLITLGIPFFFAYYQSAQGRKQIAVFIMRVPIINDLLQQLLMTRFSRTLAYLIYSGVPLVQALQVVEKTVENKVLQTEISLAVQRIKDGSGLVDSFHGSSFFPSLVIQMLAVGEKSGRLDKLLFKVSDYYDRELARAADRLPKMLEPLMLVFLGVVVGILVLGVMLPMFSTMSGIGH